MVSSAPLSARRCAMMAILLSTVVLVLAAAGAAAQETPRMGGVLKVAAIGEPPTLDIQATTTVLTYEIMWHVYEPLFTHDRAWNPIPMLAESDAVSDRGLLHTITLRRGVKFHNGKELTAADVVASLKRWGQVATVGKVIGPGVRQAGVETGEYHHAMFMKQDAWDRIKSLPQLESRIVRPRGWTLISMNHKAGLMTSRPLRQAVQAALDMEPIMIAAFGHKDFYPLSPAFFFPEQPAWHSTAGAPLYNQRDREKAKRLMKEAGYAGQTVRWISTREYEFMYKHSLVAKQQLEAHGFVIDLQVVDWATLNQRVQKPELWEAYVTGYPLNPDPALHVAFRCSFQ